MGLCCLAWHHCYHDAFMARCCHGVHLSIWTLKTPCWAQGSLHGNKSMATRGGIPCCISTCFMTLDTRGGMLPSPVLPTAHKILRQTLLLLSPQLWQQCLLSPAQLHIPKLATYMPSPCHSQHPLPDNYPCPTCIPTYM